MTTSRDEALRLAKEAGFDGCDRFDAYDAILLIELIRLARQPDPELFDFCPGLNRIGPRKIGGPFLPKEVARNAKKAAEGNPILYLCPAGCGCTWRDNEDGTMSLGLAQQSCEVCEFLPLDKLVPLFMRQPDPEVVGLLREARTWIVQSTNEAGKQDILSRIDGATR